MFVFACNQALVKFLYLYYYIFLVFFIYFTTTAFYGEIKVFINNYNDHMSNTAKILLNIRDTCGTYV